MKNTIKYTDIINRNPCYDPSEIGMSKDYEASAPEFIKEYRSKVKDKRDILWVVLRGEYMTKNELFEYSLFAANRVRRIIKYVISLNAMYVLEHYLSGEATEDELKTAACASSIVAAAAHAAVAAANADNSAAASYIADGAAAHAADAAYIAAYAANPANAEGAIRTSRARRESGTAAKLCETNAQIDKLIEIFEKGKGKHYEN